MSESDAVPAVPEEAPVEQHSVSPPGSPVPSSPVPDAETEDAPAQPEQQPLSPDPSSPVANAEQEDAPAEHEDAPAEPENAPAEPEEDAAADREDAAAQNEEHDEQEQRSDSPGPSSPNSAEGEGENTDKKELLANIFGEDSDEDEENDKDEDAMPSSSKAQDEDEDEPRFLGRERDDSEEESNTKEWDFDVMMRQKKKENKKRRRRKDGTYDLISDMDDQIKDLVEKMQEAANQDRVANDQRKPALKKRMMLAVVKSTMLKADLCDTLLDNGMMSAVSEWLAPLPDKSLPSLEIRTSLLKVLQGYSNLEQGILKQSGLGKAVMLLYKHPRETKENKEMANRLIRDWSRPIFQSEVDMRMDKEERTQRDWEHIPEVKRKKMSFEEFQNRQKREKAPAKDKQPTIDQQPEPEPNNTVGVGEKGFVGRARVPRPSTRDYIVRPKPKVDQQFREPTKNRSTSRFDRAQREFLDRTRKNKSMRALSISLEGRKME